MIRTDGKPTISWAPQDREEAFNPHSQPKSPAHWRKRRRRRLIAKISRRRNLR